MSFCANVRTKSKIKYDRGWFNYEQEPLYDFLTSEPIDIRIYVDADGYGNNWEIDRDQIELAIERINKEFADDTILFSDYTKKQIIEILEIWLENTSNKEDFDYPETIYIDWF